MQRVEIAEDWMELRPEYAEAVHVRPRPRPLARLELAGLGVLGIVFLGLAGRLMSTPLSRDENLFLTVARLGGTQDIYRDLGYNHLPILPWLLGGLYDLVGTEHFLLVARLLVLAGWATALGAIWLICRRTEAGFLAFFTAACLLMGNVLLLGGAGMLATNNLLPLAPALLAFYALLHGIGSTRPAPLACFAAGVLVSCAIGLKANYIFLAPFFALATLFAPTSRGFALRLLAGTLPLAAGGLLAGLPVLMYVLFDTQSFFAHTLRYFTELQPAYWAASSEPKVDTLAARMLLAESIWLANATLLSLVGIVALALIPAMRTNMRESLRLVRGWSVVLALGLAATGFVVAFVPSPSFPQYFVPPIPFLILAVVLLRARTATPDLPGAQAVLGAMALLALVGCASRIGPGLVQLARPQQWETISLHRDMRALAREAGFSGGERVATLTPALALAGNFAVPPEFAAGQFVYRVAPYIPAGDQRYYTTTSAAGLAAFLDAAPPPAILISGEEKLEEPFKAYALSHGYTGFRRRHKGRTIELYRRPDATPVLPPAGGPSTL